MGAKSDLIKGALDLTAKLLGGGGEEAAKTGIRAYHGSPQKGLNRLSTRYAVETPNAVFAAQNPDVAHTFTIPREYGEPVYVDEFGNDIEPGEVLELNLRPQNPFSLPPEEAQKFIDDTAFQTNLVKEARQKGHDLVVAPDVLEGIGERSKGDVYAVLDDRIISIIRKYGIAGASAMLGYNLMENLDANQAQAATVADKQYQATQPEVRGGMLPPGMEPSGEMTSRIPSASERIYDYVRSVLGGDEATKGQRAETVMNIIDQTPLAVGPMAYDIGRSIAEKVAYADGGAVGESYDPDAEAAIALAKREVQGPFPPSSPQPELPSDGTYVERRPSKIERIGDILLPYVTEPVMAGKRIMTTSPHILMGYGTPEETEAAIGDALTVVSTMGGASSVVPRPANSVGVFGGVRSRTADKNALTKAQIMESQGASPEEINASTGWYRGTDEQWRYKIPDFGTSVDPSKFQIDLSSSTMPSPMKATLSDYFNHPELFAAYPEFKNMQVRTHRGGANWGYYMPRYDRGTINPGFNDPYISLNMDWLENFPDKQRSTLLHEIQHAIQQKEGFMRGANKDMFAPDTVPNPAVKIYEDALINDPDLIEFNALSKSKEFLGQVNKANEFFRLNYKPRFDKLKEAEAATNTDLTGEWFKLSDEYENAVRGMFPLMRKRGELYQSLEARGIPTSRPANEFLTPAKAYEQTAGEVEARNVQRLMDTPKEELAKIYPIKTEDIPRNQQLIDWNDTSWRKGYTDGGAVDDDITDALRIATG